MFQQNITALQTEINNTLREAKLQEEQLSRYDILSLVTSSEDGSKFMKVGEFFNEKLKLNSEKLGILHQVQKGWYKIPNFQCDGVGCRCLNRNATEDKTNIWNQWRSETWITIFVTIACMGSLIALAVISFIIWRICRGDTIEGNQGFAVLSLVGIIINYFAILPFAFNPSEALCTLRLLSVGLAYTLLFSPLLVRSLMLATADTDGLPGHVSGLVQSALYFFCVGVQGALSVEYWWLSKMQHFHLVEESGEFSKACILSHDRIFISLAYAILLLVFWIFVSPFCVRNRRNYREGLFFHIASLASLVVWAVWITGFILLAEDLREKLLCLGLVANATVVLVVIFIPRVYKMTTAIALDTANVSLRPVGQLTAPSLTDMTVRSSNVMLYDTVNHAYAPESVMHAVKEEMEASSFDEYDRCSTPSKVTRL
ncbi:protein bride of sevenless-like [Tachypleus tridentatus]|uniref:protein bride of sevenless-like n=1 Tax=Tachypleus tridentatus TaxID=6853 RepID=UPI003FD3EFC1